MDLGVDIRIIAEALGHESLESTKIYTQVSFQRTRRIAELFGSPGEAKQSATSRGPELPETVSPHALASKSRMIENSGP